MQSKTRPDTDRDTMKMFMTDSSSPNDATMMYLEDLTPYANHPFKLYEGARLDDMVRSIKEMGVIVPIIVRPHPTDQMKYEILSGHNRVNAAQIAGLVKIPAIIKNRIRNSEAELIVTETNLIQRSFTDLTHSQRAIALKRHMDVLKSQGKRNDLLKEIERLSKPDEIKENETCDPMENKLRSREQTANYYELCPTNVARYVRVALLNSELLARVDADEIAIRAAVSLSYLKPEEQAELNRLLNESTCKVDMKKAEDMRGFSASGKLSTDRMALILVGEQLKKPKPKAITGFKLKAKIYQKYFTKETPPGEIEATIDQALAEYFENHKEQEDCE